eukprot:TRINITY_DN6668_c0_g1_i2.p1 TRINITY_DN6668_c0_g1~~TRINITY_DN6668_c0_g1_i2.p1  ORF type:complete len:343 (-),score=45.90 TRINITY_DN6668_c0_g1_i2:555-1460(-)
MASGTWVTILVIIVSIVFYEYQNDIVDWSHKAIAAFDDVVPPAPSSESPDVQGRESESRLTQPSRPSSAGADTTQGEPSAHARRQQPQQVKKAEGTDSTAHGSDNTHTTRSKEPQSESVGAHETYIDKGKNQGKNQGKNKGKKKGKKKKKEKKKKGKKGGDAYSAYASANSAGAEERQRQKALHLGDLGWEADPRFEREWGRIPPGAPGVDILSSLTQEEFNSKYLSKRPFILRDLNRSIEFRSKMYKSKFMSKYGSVTVPVGSQEDLAGGGMAKDKMKLYDYVRAFARERRERQYRTDTT